MAGSVPWVALVTEPVIATRPVRVLTDRLVRPVRGHSHSVHLGVGNRLTVDPHLVPLPSPGLGHHLGDQIPTQPHLTRLALTSASTTLWPAWRLVHERPAHPLAHGQPVVPGGFNRLAAGGGRQLIASTAPALLGLDDAGVARLTSTQTSARLLVSDRSGEVGGQGVDWPPGLAPLVSTQPLKGGFICSTIRGRLHAVLARHLVPRLWELDRPTGQVVRYQRQRPGELGGCPAVRRT
jgi:hypothetical protein